MKVQINEFAYNNPSGGTMLSNGSMDPVFPHPVAVAEVTSGFYDYEVGYRFIGLAGDAATAAFRDEHGSPTDQRIFFCQFDLVDQKVLRTLVARFVPDGASA